MIFFLRIFLNARRLGVALLSTALLSGPGSYDALAQPAAEQHILLLYAYGYGGRGVELFSDGFFKAITESGFPVSNVYAEYLDLQRNKDIPDYRRELLGLLRQKYAGGRIDLIVTLQPPALDFLLTAGKDFAPQSPVIAIQQRPLLDAEKAGRHIVGEVNQFDIKGTLDRALELFPQTRRVVFASGSSAADIKLAEQAARVAGSFHGKLEFEYTTGMALDEILQRVAHLPPHSIIVFTQYNSDTKGRVALAYEAENMIVKSANAPVFGLYDYNLRNGGIGGSVIAVEASGVRTGRLAIDILQGKATASSGMLRVGENIPMFDWRQIQRWGGNVDQLPANAVLINRPPSVWRQYGGVIVGTLVFILVQTALIGVLLINIRRRKHAETGLGKSEANFQAIFEGILDSVVFADTERHIRRVNPAFTSMFGYTADEVIGRTTEFIYADPADYTEQGRCRFHGGPVSENGVYELRYRRKDGSEFWAESRGTSIAGPNGTVLGLIGTHRDITDRKKAELDLRASEQRFRRLFHEAPLPLCYVNKDGVFADYNARFEQMFGDSHTEAPTLAEWWRRVFPDSLYRAWVLDTWKAAVSLATATDSDIDPGEYRVTCTDGQVRNVIISGITLGEDFLATFFDITERRQAEEALVCKDALLQAMLRNLPFDFWARDTRQRIIMQSDESIRLWGDLAGASIATVAFEDRTMALWEANNRRVLAGEIVSEDCTLTTRNGGQREFHTIVVPIRDGDQTLGILGINIDITDRKQSEKERLKLEAQLQQVQKLEAIGQLAGGVAHDFNNMLSVIIGHAELAMDQVDPVQPLFADLQEIRSAAERSADITRQLLAFARKQTVAPRVLDLNETVEGMLKMLRRLIGEGIDLSWLPGTALWQVKVDPSQIDQIMANLCVNARDAIAGVGRITVETGNIIYDEEYCNDQAGFIPGEYVKISVGDNGSGMDRETLTHIFEPFFTTKDVGEGTGLGLATVYGAVKQNKGFINAYSEPGQGTTFTIYLPRYVSEAGLVRTEVASEPALRGHETILLVEDEPKILKMTTMMLQRLGYNVLAADCPGGAIRLVSEHTGEIDLLATDVIMPEMNGRMLAERLKLNQPAMKCLFMSGYTADIIANQGVLDENVCFIQKPFSQKELAAKIRQALERGET